MLVFVSNSLFSIYVCWCVSEFCWWTNIPGEYREFHLRGGENQSIRTPVIKKDPRSSLVLFAGLWLSCVMARLGESIPSIVYSFWFIRLRNPMFSKSPLIFHEFSLSSQSIEMNDIEPSQAVPRLWCGYHHLSRRHIDCNLTHRIVDQIRSEKCLRRYKYGNDLLFANQERGPMGASPVWSNCSSSSRLSSIARHGHTPCCSNPRKPSSWPKSKI